MIFCAIKNFLLTNYPLQKIQLRKLMFCLFFLSCSPLLGTGHNVCSCHGNNPQRFFRSDVYFEDQIWDAGGIGSYCPYDPVSYEQRINFYVDFEPQVHCDYFIAFSFGEVAGTQRRMVRVGGPGFLDYNLYKSPGQTNLLLPLNVANSANVLVREFTGHEHPPIQETIYWQVPSLQLIPAGIYKDRVIVRLYIGDINGDFCPGDNPKHVDFFLQVCSFIDLSIVEPGGAFLSGDTEEVLSFGIVNPGDFKEADVLVRSNTSFKLYFRSENNNVLLHENNFPGGSVPYQLKVNNILQDLSSGQDELVGTHHGVTPVGGELFRTRVTIGNFATPPAGTYRDKIYVTVTVS